MSVVDSFRRAIGLDGVPANPAPVVREHAWILDEALALVRFIQPMTRAFGYHLAIGGGVVNRGFSDKDLDLYFLAMEDSSALNPTGLLVLLDAFWGQREDIGNGSYRKSHYKHKVKYAVDGRRIDVFVVE